MAERDYPHVVVTRDMLSEAERLKPSVAVARTQASPIDTLVGILGEFAFAEYYCGDWRRHTVGRNKGQVDFGDVEVKASAFRFKDNLNLLVREDYAKSRLPAAYAQAIIDVSPDSDSVPEGAVVVLAGWEEGSVVHDAPLRDFGAKGGGPGGYRCHFIAIKNLRPMEALRGFLRSRKQSM